VEGLEKTIQMIQTQSQNEEIRQIEKIAWYEVVWWKVRRKVWYQVFWDVGDEVRGKVRCEVWFEAWRKLFL
jgi:hypothetical protein